MKDILTQNNTDLVREILIIRKRVEESITPLELNAYKKWLLDTLDIFDHQIQNNFDLIKLDQSILVSEILSETQNLTINLRALTERYLAPILRYTSNDLFCLKAINWLHEQHNQSKDIPFAVSDGSFAIFPTTDTPVIYFLPASSLNNLIHIPLIFHEFGHYLYAYHQEEMDDLVKDLQTKIWNKCRPSYIGNDPRNSSSYESLNKIVETWYEWMQEFFCDAVGLHVGGQSYLKTFSIYLRMMGRGQFRVNENELIQSSHPVSWLRIKLLAKRAVRLGLEKQADEIVKSWNHIAQELHIKEEYYGFYHSSFGDEVYGTLEDMLIESNPIEFKNFIVDNNSSNLIQLVNKAWSKYTEEPDDYEEWESTEIDEFISQN